MPFLLLSHTPKFPSHTPTSASVRHTSPSYQHIPLYTNLWDGDNRTRLSAQFLILNIKVCEHPNPNPLRNSSTGSPCSHPIKSPTMACFYQSPVPLVTPVHHHCLHRPPRTFITNTLAAITRFFAVFPPSTLLVCLLSLFRPPSPPGDMLDSFALFPRSVWHIRPPTSIGQQP